jgi:hypothetical protein
VHTIQVFFDIGDSKHIGGNADLILML